MKKLIVIIVATLAACVAAVALMESSASAQQPNLIDHYKCYQARHAKRTPRFVSQPVFVTDQFRHNVELSVLKLNTHCSTADQEIIYDGTSAGAQFQDGLNCYTIRDAPRQARFTPQNIDVEDKLSNGMQTLTVSKAQSLCVPSLKFPPFGGRNLFPGAFVCYQAKTAKGQPRFQQRTISIDDQFVQKEVRVIRPVAYCSLAEKKNEARPDRKNDNFGNRHELNEFDLPFEDHISTVNATVTSDDPIISCKTDYTHSVWYRWQGQQQGADRSLIIDTFGSTYDTVVAVFRGEDLDEEVACRRFSGQNNSGAAGDFGPIQIDAEASTEYFILVGSNEGRGGKLKFHVEAKDDAPNDNFANATTIPNLQTQFIGLFRNHVSTMNATTEGNDPALTCVSGSPEYSNSVWYQYTPTKHEFVSFNTFSSSYDTVLAVFEGPKATPTELGCNDDIDGTLQSRVRATVKAGTTYRILVGSKGSSEGGKLKFEAFLFESLSSGRSAGAEGLGIPDDSLTCYQVRQARHRTETDTVADQFSGEQDPWTLIIGGVNSVCVPSNKDECPSGVDALRPAAPSVQCP